MRTPILVLAVLTTLAHASPPVPEAASRFREHGLAEAPAKEPGRVRLATYNIHELFDHADDPVLSGRQDDLARAMPETRQSATADALTRLDADILAMQEVESIEALLWYRDTHLAAMGYDHLASIDAGHAIGLEQAVLSRFPIIESKTWPDLRIGVHPQEYRGRPNRYAGQPLHFRRSPLMVELDLSAEGAGDGAGEGDRLTLVVVHFKTGAGSEAWRLAEAGGVAEIIAGLRADRPDRRVVVLGDFAEGVAEGHVGPLLAAGFTDAFAGAGEGAAETATNINGRRDCLILLDADTASSAGTRFVLGTVVPPRGLSRAVGFRMPGFASDHYPLAVDLALSAE